MFVRRLAGLNKQLSHLVKELLANIERQIRQADRWLEQRQLRRLMLPAFHCILRRRVERTSFSEDGAWGAGLQPGLLKKSGKLQQSLWRASRIDTEGQALDLFLSGHPEWNREPSLLELDFDMLPAVESMRAKDLQFLEMERMKRVRHRNSARIAGIIAAGLKA